jgi:transglutaminase-like putative cysteine protease
MFSRRAPLLALVFCLCVLVHFSSRVRADDWQPINPEELKMTSVPEAPGAAAVYLYRQVDRDDTTNHETEYLRIKILTEEGRKYANIEIPYQKENANVLEVKARTIRPDGSITNYQGKPVEKMIVKAKGIKVLAKVLLLPDVQAGSIIEYRYTTEFKENFVFNSHWILSGELFTKRAKFSLKPYGYIPVRWIWQSLPAGTSPPKNERNVVHLESSNIPAFQTEDYMPPENELKSRVDFIYSENDETQADKFWKKEAKKQNDKVESFVGKRKAMEQVVGQIVAAGDTPEVKLQKIYARVQQLRNTSYEEQVTDQEKKRAKEKAINNVEDLWKNGYGSGREITWLFLALARAAGIEAYPMLVAGRNEYFFHPNSMDPNRLDDNVVMVKLKGENSFYDPGSARAPFGILPWQETAVVGLKLDKDGGEWITTSVPDGTVSNIQRKANLKLTDQGSLEGKLTVTFSGLEGLSVRQTQRNSDAAARKKFLEDEVREFVPVGIDVELTNTPDWSSSALTLVAEYDLKVQGWAAQAGRRALIPVGLFGAPEKHVFEHAARVHPIYFNFPTARIDDVTIELPLDWKVSSVPPEHKDPGKVCAFNTSVENKNGTLHLTRNLDIATLALAPKYYGALRNFFQTVRTGDDQQIVVQPGAAAAAN